MNFHYVYVLQNKEKSFIYVGQTKDLRKRFAEHNNSKVISTKHYLPLDLVFYEAYKSPDDAYRREGYLKTNKGATTLKTMLKESLIC